MQTLFLDIDNTLIYSHRRAMTVPKRAVELLNGREQSFISQQTYSFLTGKHGLQIVPVTTRTLIQFQRLENLMRDLGCEYSLICNGAVLLHNMEIDQSWYEETLALAGSELSEIDRAKKWLIDNCGEASTYSAFDVLVYAKSCDPEGLASELRQYIDTSRSDVLFDRSKVYCIPKSLNKGTAVRRFSQRFNVTVSIAAGDSDFDIPMLNQADVAIAPEALFDKLINKNTIAVKEKECFSDEICSVLDGILFSGETDTLLEMGKAKWNNP